MRLLNRVNSVLVFLFGIGLFSISPFATAVQAQTGQRITFGVNPSIFRAGQLARAELSISSVSTYPLTLSAGNTFIFFVDGSFGTVLSLTTPITVNSSSLLESDFTASLGPSQGEINITYIGQPKTFVFGDSMSLNVALLASAQSGPGKLSLSSQFVSVVNGNLPFTTVSIVDFANSGTSAVTHDQTLMGDGTGAMPLGIAPGGVTTGDLATGAVTAPKIASGQVVKSLNSLFDNVSLAGGSNITITPSGNTLFISAPSSLSSITHDATLTGLGTGGSPLGVAAGGIGTSQLAGNAVSLSNIAPGQVVTSLNNLKDSVTLAAGSNVTITPSGNTLTVAASSPSHAAFTATGAVQNASNEQQVLSKTVPAGTYVIHARIVLTNNDSDNQYGNCRLSTGEQVYVLLSSGYRRLAIPLLDTATFASPTAINLFCQGYSWAAEGKLIAISVDSIQ
jgi:hypothetical protein